MGGMKTPFWSGINEENTGGLMERDDVAEIILANTKSRKNIIMPIVIIKNH